MLTATLSMNLSPCKLLSMRQYRYALVGVQVRMGLLHFGRRSRGTRDVIATRFLLKSRLEGRLATDPMQGCTHQALEE